MSNVPKRVWPVKWSFEIIRRGRARYKRTVKVACHAPRELEGGGEDLVRCGTALVTILGWRPQYIGTVTKTIGKRRWTYHVTQPYTDKEACKLACENSVLAGQRFEAQWEQADEETRARWAKADRGVSR